MRTAAAKRHKRRATVELVLAVVAAVGAVWSWFGAQSVVTVAPILPGEPQTTSVAFSPPMAEANQVIKDFLFARMYRHWRVNRMTTKARRLTEEVFRLLHADPSLLPDDWRARAGEAGTTRAAMIVGDYVAGMTDRYAMDEHRRLTDISVSG